MSMKDLSNIVINNKYRIQKRVGSGSYGIVYSAMHLYTGISYAIKIILKNNSTNTTNNKQLLVELEKSLIYQALLNNGCLQANLLSLESIEKNGTDCKFLREISLQLKVHRHPNVLSIYKVYDFQNSIFVVMDYYPDGDLFTTIVDQQRYKDDPFLVKSAFIQLVDSINYCHSKSVYHCDLKPENILVAENGTKLVLADFGLALQDTYINSNISCGSSYYMSPERIQNFSQAFNTLESHSIHIERLLNPNSNSSHSYPAHGNVKFPTSSGDVWSLAIILINLVSIRNPWLKASLQDTTFKAFVQNPKVLMKILPISQELFDILGSYLNLNPWERGSLFQFREDILQCRKLTEAGPLSIDSSIQSMDIITTQSQYNIMHDLSHFEVCPIPVDHVAIDKLRSGELDVEHAEVENDYMPHANRSPNSNGHHDQTGMVDFNSNNTKKECKSCVDCGYGIEDESSCGSTVIRKVESSTMSSSTSSTGSLASYDNTHRHKSPEPKHENLLKKFFKYGPGGYNPTKNYNSSPSSGKKHHLSPFKRSDSREHVRVQQHQLQEQLQQQQLQNHARQQQQLQRQLQQQQYQQTQQQLQERQYLQQQQQQQRQQQRQQQQQQAAAQHNQNEIQNLQDQFRQESLQQRRQQLEQMQQQQQQQQQQQRQRQNIGQNRHSDDQEHHHHHHHRQQPQISSNVVDYQSIFPMPGMGLNKQVILGQDRPKKKFVTKRRQRRTIVTSEQEPQEQQQQQQQQQDKSQESVESREKRAFDSEDHRMDDADDTTPHNSGNSELSAVTNPAGIEDDDDTDTEDVFNDSVSSIPSVQSMHSNQSNPYVNRISASTDVTGVEHTLSTMSILSNASSATMATMATRGSTMDQRMN